MAKDNNKPACAGRQKGISLIITFFVMVIILSVVLFVSVLLYSEVKILRNIGNSMTSLYAADSGIEKVLYYDRQVLPTLKSGKTAVRGLCTMIVESNSDGSTNPNYCAPGASGETSIYCNPTSLILPMFHPYNDTLNDNYDQLRYNPNGCDPSFCDDCQISFTSALDNGSVYTTTARVFPDADGKSSDFEIESKGTFGGAGRQIKITINTPNTPITQQNAQ